MAPAGGGWGWLLTLCAVLVCQAGAAMDSLVSVDYEIFGKVQGVFFRKHTQVWAPPRSASPPWLRPRWRCAAPALTRGAPVSPFPAQAEGRQLGLVGWVRNTERGTVQGQVQGPAAAVRQLQQWLRDTGSPKSRIDRAEFRNEKKVATLQYEDFLIRK